MRGLRQEKTLFGLAEEENLCPQSNTSSFSTLHLVCGCGPCPPLPQFTKFPMSGMQVSGIQSVKPAALKPPLDRSGTPAGHQVATPHCWYLAVCGSTRNQQKVATKLHFHPAGVFYIGFHFAMRVFCWVLVRIYTTTTHLASKTSEENIQEEQSLCP